MLKITESLILEGPQINIRTNFKKFLQKKATFQPLKQSNFYEIIFHSFK